MKKILMLSLIMAVYSLIYAQSNESNDILILRTNNLSEQQSVLGLYLVQYKVTNSSNNSIRISEPAHWAFSASIKGKVIFFFQVEMISSDVHYINMVPHDTLVGTLHLNFSNLAEQYLHETGEILSAPTEVIFCINLDRNDSGKRTPYSSKPDTITLYPLEKEDKMAFEYIQSKGFNPYYLTSGIIAVCNIDSAVLQTVISTYPTSTFAELANLSLAYKQARDGKTGPAYKKEQVLQYLARPLTSKYSYVRYLAEALRKTQL